MILSAKDYIAESKYFKDTAIIIGHVGDGNFHIFTGVDPSIPDEVDDIKLLASKVAKKSLELGGTCTGEHGVGLGKDRTSYNNLWAFYTANSLRGINNKH